MGLLKMTPELQAKYEQLNSIINDIGPQLLIWDAIKGTFEEDAQRFSGGALDVIIPHFMSIQDMHTTQDNLKDAIKISRAITTITDVLTKNIATNKPVEDLDNGTDTDR
jgi:acyl carrier protein phosphodiesterase